MTLMEKLVEKGQALGYKTATQLFSAAGVNSNAQLTCNRKGTLSNTNKQRLARVLKCSIGEINQMMMEALREANAEKNVSLEEQYANETPIGEPEQETPSVEQEQHDESEAEQEEPIGEPEEPSDEFDYATIIHKRAAEALRLEYAKLLEAKMLDVAKSDLRQVCEHYLETDTTDFIASMHKISGIIMEMEEK
ncbi:hypothetical protein [uncultured Phascolarctobacterium sp.]|uniref:hypothetical protein n=1 Tax=uncultured Phascolarctobacterium sp. TaxID=512296 RepID=UPI0025CB8CF6|nr:hypothetical protein [uncultured Phascolarctobacterium sp.]